MPSLSLNQFLAHQVVTLRGLPFALPEDTCHIESPVTCTFRSRTFTQGYSITHLPINKNRNRGGRFKKSKRKKKLYTLGVPKNRCQLYLITSSGDGPHQIGEPRNTCLGFGGKVEAILHAMFFFKLFYFARLGCLLQEIVQFSSSFLGAVKSR